MYERSNKKYSLIVYRHVDIWNCCVFLKFLWLLHTVSLRKWVKSLKCERKIYMYMYISSRKLWLDHNWPPSCLQTFPVFPNTTNSRKSVTGQQRMLTPIWHLILPLIFFTGPGPVLYFSIELLIFNTARYHHMSPTCHAHRF